jgi:hypothetical protein
MILDLRGKAPHSNAKRQVSSIKKIVRHHSATTEGNFWVFWNYWNGTLKWNTGGYHEIILRDGSVELCYPPEIITNGVKSHNAYTYHICVVGNGRFTDEQEKAFKERSLNAMSMFNLKVDDVVGHGELDPSTCPGIDMNKVRESLREKPTEHWEEKMYNDKDKIAKWALPSVEEAKKLGLMVGDDKGNFNPKENVTREQLAVALVNLYKKAKG